MFVHRLTFSMKSQSFLLCSLFSWRKKTLRTSCGWVVPSSNLVSIRLRFFRWRLLYVNAKVRSTDQKIAISYARLGLNLDCLQRWTKMNDIIRLNNQDEHLRWTFLMNISRWTFKMNIQDEYSRWKFKINILDVRLRWTS